MGYHVDPDIRKASTLPASYYRDEDAFELGREQYFANSWQFITDANQIKVPGQVYPFEFMPGLIGEPLVFTRDTQDQIHCISNVCTHRGTLVCEGAGNERFLRCRYHGRRFGLDGRFQHMPEFEEVENFPTEADNLKPISHAQWGPLLFTSLHPHSPWAEWMAPMLERMAFLPLHEFRHAPEQSRDYMVRAHWALYVDNYLEGFHIPFIHASLNEVINYDTYAYELYDGLNLQLAESSGADHAFDLPLGHPQCGQSISAFYWWVFPNMMFNFYPWGLSINVVKPLAMDLTKVSFVRYVWDESKLGSGAGGDLDRVEREDEAVVEAVQKGVQSRFYDRGRFAPKREIGTHHFHYLLADRLRDCG